MDTIFKLLKACTELTGEEAKKRNPDPLKALTMALHDRICATASLATKYDRFLGEIASSKEELVEAVKSHDDARVLYAKLVTFVLRQLAEALRDKGEDYLISMTNLGAIDRTLQFYVPAAVLPYLEQGVGAPLEKRSALVKYWKRTEDVEERKERLHEAMECWFQLTAANKSLLYIMNSKLLPDMIAINEQLLHMGDASLIPRYETFIYNDVHRSHLIAQFLSLIGGFGVGDKRVPAPQWLKMSIGTKLSLAVAGENGLVFLFGAFDDLGGEQFWKNYSTLTRVAALLATCPKSKKPREYYVDVTTQFLGLIRHPQWANNLAMLFALFVDEGAKRFRGILDVLVMDRLLSPFERLVESCVGFEKTEERGYWSKELDESLQILYVWLGALPRITEIPFLERLQRVFLTLAVMYESAPETRIKQDLQVILRRIVRACGTFESQAECLLKQAVLAADERRVLIVESKKKAMIEEIGEDVKPVEYTYDVFLDVSEEPEALKIRISAILALLETFPKDEKRKIVMELLSTSVKRWRALDERNVVGSRFVDIEGDSEVERMCVQYIMGAVVEIYLSNDDVHDGESLLCIVDVCDVILTGVCSKLADRFDLKRRMDVVKAEEPEEIAVDTKSIELAIGVIGGVMIAANRDPELMRRLERMSSTMKRFTRVVDTYAAQCSQELKLLSGSVRKLIEAMGGVAESTAEDLEVKDEAKPSTSTDELELCLRELEDPAEAVRGHSLIMLARWMRQRAALIDRMDPELVFEKILTQLEDEDSYVYLTAVGALAELAFWQTEPYLGRLVALFAEEHKIDENLKLRCKLGEALGKVFRQLGDFAPLYFVRMVGVLLKLTSEGDELVKASALSGLSDLIVACRGRRFDSDINEIISCINRLLATEKSSLVRRASVNLLRSVISSCHYNIFETLPDHLRDIRRSLSALWKSDRDEVVRLHAELALIEIRESLNTHARQIEESGIRRIRI